MQDLHEKGIFHRDLKASNVLLRRNFGNKNNPFMENDRGIVVADFECSIGVVGTKFWRAPEILATLGSQETITNGQWKQANVYSYAMTCFEIVTGRIPFDGELENTRVDRQLVIEGKRPQLPSGLDDTLKDLITQCWKPTPSSRPTFVTTVNTLVPIVDTIESISTGVCPFRLFGIDDELPQQYHLATVQEVNDYLKALMKAMSGWEIVNLANGSIEGSKYYRMETRLEKRSDAGRKLARFHH